MSGKLQKREIELVDLLGQKDELLESKHEECDFLKSNEKLLRNELEKYIENYVPKDEFEKVKKKKCDAEEKVSHLLKRISELEGIADDLNQKVNSTREDQDILNKLQEFVQFFGKATLGLQFNCSDEDTNAQGLARVCKKIEVAMEQARSLPGLESFTKQGGLCFVLEKLVVELADTRDSLKEVEKEIQRFRDETMVLKSKLTTLKKDKTRLSVALESASQKEQELEYNLQEERETSKVSIVQKIDIVFNANLGIPDGTKFCKTAVTAQK